MTNGATAVYDRTAAIRAIDARLVDSRPIVVAIEARSGVGKSTFARQIADEVDANVIQGDDFYAGGVTLRPDGPGERMAHCIDWKRQRPVLEALRRSERAAWCRFDWDAFDGSLEASARTCDPPKVVLLEGVYCARHELRDLLDLRVLLRAPQALHIKQLVAREGSISPWEKQWLEAEDHYFASVVSADGFDLVLDER